NGPTWLFDIDTLTQSINYQPVDADLSDEFEEFFVNITNRVNATSAPVTAVGLNSTNSINSFNAAGSFDNAVSPNFEIVGKYSFVDPSQYPDDPYMTALEDIVYSDDEEDVGNGPTWLFDIDTLTQSMNYQPVAAGCRFISWQCKKQIVVATSSTEAEYVAAASCCAQVLWIQNQLLDYG
nr:putative ribonuclease H-like domain-containing protein [Tanacetum cinerariifolium]